MGKKVLVVDDESSLRRMVAFALMQRGYDTELCENGTKGLQALETYKKNNLPLDFAIIDVRLPDIDGLELLKAIKANYPSIPVVIITGHGKEQVAEEIKNADGFLEKPFDMDELAKLLDQIPGAKAVEVPPPKVQREQLHTAYVLVTLDPAADLMDLYRKLSKVESVVFCDAVRGEDLMLLMQSESEAKLAAIIDGQIKTVPGVAEVETLSVETPLVAENVGDIISAVNKAGGQDKPQLRSRFVLSLIDFLDVLRTR